MSASLGFLTALAFTYSGFTALSQTLDRHYADRHGRGATPSPAERLRLHAWEHATGCTRVYDPARPPEPLAYPGVARLRPRVAILGAGYLLLPHRTAHRSNERPQAWHRDYFAGEPRPHSAAPYHAQLFYYPQAVPEAPAWVLRARGGWRPTATPHPPPRLAVTIDRPVEGKSRYRGYLLESWLLLTVTFQ